MKKQKKMWPWIVILSVFTVIMIVDIIAWTFTSKMNKRFEGKNNPFESGDNSFPNMPSDFDGEKPEFPSGKDGEDFSFPSDGERPDFNSDSSGERPDFNGDFPGTPTGKSNPFSKLKVVFPIVLIICILMDIFAVIMLIRAITFNKKINGGDGGDDGSYGGNGGDSGSDKAYFSNAEESAGGEYIYSAEAVDNTAETETIDDVEENIHSKIVKKQRIGRIVLAALSLMVLGVIVTLSVLSKQKKVDTSSVTAEETVIETSLQDGTLASVVTAGGAVTAEAAEIQYFPEGIEISSYKVSEGDIVSEGDVVAEVDRTSVISTIKEIQSVITDLDKELEELSDEASSKMTAGADGTIVKIYASSGESVVDVVSKYGALMLISLDGKIPEEIGNVEDGTDNILAVTGYEGIIDEINVEEGDEVDKGDTLLKLTEGVYSARYESLLKQREKLEEQMQTLFELYQTGEIKAVKDGEIVEIDSSLTNVTYKAGRVRSKKLSNSPTGEDDSALINFAVLVTGVNDTELQIKMSANPIGEVDYTTVGSIDPSVCTNAQTISKATVSRVFGYNGAQWIPQTAADIQTGDVMISSFDSSGNLIWMVRRITAAAPTETPTPSPSAEPSAQPSAMPSDMPSAMPSAQPSPGGKDNPTDPSAFPSAQPGTNTQPNGNGNNQGGQNGVGNSGFPSGSGSFSGGFSSGGSTFSDIEPEEDENPVYAVAEIAVYSISSRNKVDVSIAIDELDITKIYLGQTCEVTFDAINAKTYEGTVTKISSTGENSGGNTKYTVIVTMDREEDMLSGMNTHITFTTETKDGVKVVPESAIIEKDDKTYVYTAYDKETDELGGLKEVTLGLADGDNVEVLSGLDSGDVVYYRYADTLTYTFIND